jgi:hypothetical protein
MLDGLRQGRYAARSVNFVHVVGPHHGLAARSAARDAGLTSRTLCRDIKGRALGWLVMVLAEGEPSPRPSVTL